MHILIEIALQFEKEIDIQNAQQKRRSFLLLVKMQDLLAKSRVRVNSQRGANVEKGCRLESVGNVHLDVVSRYKVALHLVLLVYAIGDW